MDTRKAIALTRQTCVSKVMFLLLNMLSRLVIAFLARRKHLLISWLQSPSAVILKLPPKKVWHCFHCFPIYFPWSDGTGCHDFRFLKTYRWPINRWKDAQCHKLLEKCKSKLQWDITSHRSERPSSKSLQTINAAGVGKMNTLALLVEM